MAHVRNESTVRYTQRISTYRSISTAGERNFDKTPSSHVRGVSRPSKFTQNPAVLLGWLVLSVRSVYWCSLIFISRLIIPGGGGACIRNGAVARAVYALLRRESVLTLQRPDNRAPVAELPVPYRHGTVETLRSR